MLQPFFKNLRNPVINYPMYEEIKDDYKWHTEFMEQDAELGHKIPDGYMKTAENNGTHQQYVKLGHYKMSSLGKIMYPLTSLIAIVQFYFIFVQIARTRAINQIKGSSLSDALKTVLCTCCACCQVANEHEIFTDAFLS